VNALRHRLSLAGTREDGFSLIEVVVALFVFALVATGTAYTLLSVLALNRDSRVRHLATNLAAEEIDLAHDTDDILALGDTAYDRVLGTDTFHVSRTTRWVAGTGTDDACGAGAGALSYKRVNIEVSWNGMRAGSTPVRADSIVTPRSHLNAVDTGTILASVTAASGSGSAGITVAARRTGETTVRASAVTNADGCAFLTGVTPGTYDVSASRAGYVGTDQTTAPRVSVPVTAAASAGAAFQLDRASTVTVDYASNRPTGTVYFPNNLVTTRFDAGGTASHTALSGTGTHTSRTQTAQLFPFASGYEFVAGKYLAPATSPVTPPTTGPSVAGACLSPDPRAWPAVTESGTTRVGTRASAATTPGGAATARVPMGIVTVAGIPAGAILSAITAAPPAGSGDPGCATPVAYTFGAVPAGSTIALPFGTWTLSTTATTGAGSVVVPASSITLNSRGSTTPATNTVTVDPREVAP
jgi:prepilin-type N-terminal cleavage/methylation domain-containing protein